MKFLTAFQKSASPVLSLSGAIPSTQALMGRTVSTRFFPHSSPRRPLSIGYQVRRHADTLANRDGSKVGSVAVFSSSSGNDDDTTSILSSKRGRNAVKLLPIYLADARAVTKYDPIKSPDGALQLGVAESLIIQDWLLPAVNLDDLQLPPDALYYQPTQGRLDCRTAMMEYIQSDLLDLSDSQSGIQRQLDIDGIVVGAGCNAVLENLCFCLAEPGDAVLLPTPYYAAFEFDLVARAGLTVQPVRTQDYVSATKTTLAMDDAKVEAFKYFPNTTSLDAAYEKAVQSGHTPRILLLSHPHNPLGVCYPPSIVKECIDWCRSRQVHLISDEIYAGSVYRPGHARFESALKLAATTSSSDSSTPGLGLGPFIHWVYAFSKDYCLSGMRVGCAYSENEEIRVPMQKLNDMCQISAQTQLWTTTTLQRRMDDGELWTSAFRRENHKRLDDRAQRLTKVLDECGISYLQPESGLFVWLDLSDFLDPPTVPNQSDMEEDSKRERKLYLELVNDFGLLLTPGLSMRNEEPGFFRCVFTAASDDEFEISLDRFRKFAASKQVK